MELKDLLRKKRLEKGLTLQEVADAANVSASTISRYERVMLTGTETLDIFNDYIRNAAEYYSQIFDLTPVVWKKKQ